MIWFLDDLGCWAGEAAQRQGSSFFLELELMVVKKLVSGVASNVMPWLVLGQARHRREAAQALARKRWLEGKGDMEVAMWAVGEPSAVKKC